MKKVSRILFSDGGRYKDDMFVSVNGHRFNIKRGVEVSIPQYVAEVIDNSLNQDKETAKKISSIAKG